MASPKDNQAHGGAHSTDPLEDYAKAILNMMEDFADEKARLEDSQHAVINILDDFSAEKERLEETEKATLNILEDFLSEKARLEDAQRAMLNLLEDFDVERTRAEAAHRDLQESFESLRVAKEAAEAATREVESFSYSVSHDLRAPLRSLSGFSQLLLKHYRDALDDTGKDYLTRIVNAADKMGMLIDDLLKLSSISRAAIEIKKINLSMMAGRAVNQLSALHPERNVEFKTEEGIFAFGDERLIAVALENLIGNAWKFTSKTEKAVIEFGVEYLHEGERAYFVRDNGAGFETEYAGKLFNPFQRLHRDEEFPGTGIGLATVKRIIDRHGGRIWIEGAKGKGATVYFTLQGDGNEG